MEWSRYDEVMMRVTAAARQAMERREYDEVILRHLDESVRRQIGML